MTCHGLTGDYLCPGWRARADAIRKRDGSRCRGCNRKGDEIQTEVHHRRYGTPGACGQCVLTAVTDDDLILLCIHCHDAITSVRRRVRYSDREIDVAISANPASPVVITIQRDGMVAEISAEPEKPDRVVIRRSSSIL